MEYCGPRAIPWSFFVGMVAKPMWDQISRDAALLWQDYERRLCTACGTHPDDWDTELGGHPRAFVATVLTCKGCATQDGGRERLKSKLEQAGAYLGLKRQVPRRPV